MFKFLQRSSASVVVPEVAQPTGEPKRRTWFGRTMSQLFKSSLVSANDRWTGTSVSPDQFITLRQSTLVARSREQWSNNDYVRAFIRLVRQNVVGPLGVTMQAKAETPRGKMDVEANAAIEAAWLEWGKKGNCDVTGKLSWRESQCLAAETTARDGEFIIRKVYGNDAGPFGFAIQFIDPQRLPVRFERAQNKDGSFIRHGIEYSRYGRAVAYHFTSTDNSDPDYHTYGGNGFIRVPAEEIIHEFIHEMVGQRRGLPWASTSLFRLHHLQGFEDAAVQNARAGATKMGFIEWESGFGPEAEDDTDIAAGISAEPLSFHELPEGAKFKEFAPQYPNGEFQPFHKAMLRGAAAGMGVLYNNMAGDLEGVNFSSIRQGTLDEREHWKELQQWLIEAMTSAVYGEWLKYCLLSGRIITKNGKTLPADKLNNYRKVSWQPRRWQWIDPRADVVAAISSIRAGLTSISQVIRDQGRDPETVFKEWAADIEAMKAAGIADDIVMLFLLGKPPAPEPNKPNEAEE